MKIIIPTLAEMSMISTIYRGSLVLGAPIREGPEALCPRAPRYGRWISNPLRRNRVVRGLGYGFEIH
jgi:hypothetical protein